MNCKRDGLIALEDGTVYRGQGFGFRGTVTGEAVFNTSLTGYQEILTDPSYYQQIVTMTCSQIGNYGVNSEDVESETPKVQALVVREFSKIHSNWRSEGGLDHYLLKNKIPGLAEVDTRALAKRLRSAGAMKCCLSNEGISAEDAIRKAQEWEGLEGVDNVSAVTTSMGFRWDNDSKDSKPFTVEGTNLSQFRPKTREYKLAVYDFGAKFSIYRKLRHHGFDVHVFPAQTSAEEIKEFQPEALFLSNGPGDPAAVKFAHENVRKLLELYPTFGICLGHQMITHALGAETFKLKFGHRGGNQPVKNIETGKVSITSQNHGFASSKESLENRGAIVTETNLNDGTVEGLRHKDLPIFSVQYHPEAAPGPNDADPLFEDFYNIVSKTVG
jgi:carbamoyl-phosphate synthase small subunit